MFLYRQEKGAPITNSKYKKFKTILVRRVAKIISILNIGRYIYIGGHTKSWIFKIIFCHRR